VGLLDGFDATWSQARATFGQGTPNQGAAFQESGQRLENLQDTVASARPSTQWTGSAADSYAAANDAHGRVMGNLAQLDRRLAGELSRSAAVVNGGRADLDATRAWVRDAAATMPPTAQGQRMLMPIVQKGLREIADTVQRSNSDLASIARRIDAIGDEYRALDRPVTGEPVNPAPDVQKAGGDDKTVPGKPVRPFDGVLSEEEWRIARLSPTLLDEWEQARAQGWTFTSNPGEGTYTNSDQKRINIDPELAKNGPFQRVNALSHELGHALHSPPIDRSSKEAYVDSQLDGEGAATMNTIKIEREILAAGGADIVPAAPNDDGYERIYDAYVQAGSTPEAYQNAIRQIGQVYGTLTPSTDPSTNYREYYGRDYK